MEGKKTKFFAFMLLQLLLVNNLFLLLDKIVPIFNSEKSVSINRQISQKYVKIIDYRNGSTVRKTFIRDKYLVKRAK